VSQSDADGNPIHNEILLSIPQAERDRVYPELEFARLKTDQVLHDVNDTLKSAYFCNSGMVSLVNVFSNGQSVEVGLVGKEGFVGLPILAGFQSSNLRAIIQIEATAFRVDCGVLEELLAECPTLVRKLQQFEQVRGMEATQIAACNRVHEVEKRLARWLLMCADRVGDNSLLLTQELLGQMLGTRRASVTVAAGILQKAGVIRYVRGTILITDRAKLEAAACECYLVMQRQKERWRRETL
jgi:CRP-like cAMP-binding protein